MLASSDGIAASPVWVCTCLPCKCPEAAPGRVLIQTNPSRSVQLFRPG